MTTVMTGERILPDACRSEAEYILYLRHLFAYRTATAAFKSSDAVLDIGCGAGYGTRMLADRARRAVGVDVVPDAVAQASAAFASANCVFQLYDGDRLPFEDRGFDAATSFQTIEHVSDDNRFVAEAARVLKPGAPFVLTTPNRAMRLREGQRPWNRFHVREYTSTELESLLARHFGSVEMRGVRASAAVEQVERARVRFAQRVASLDPLGLLRIVPAALLARLGRLRRRTPSTSSTWPHVVEDFHATPEDRDTGFDLLAICRR
ncbi:MAG TPA: class I SAM-dependent methyltransferase [Vicinamibacterales bacterium]|jgi:SAM-dependent methyltransferase|nr:class I SAM-dependent methyltransferase [Vicinamibacterales bacterium]